MDDFEELVLDLVESAVEAGYSYGVILDRLQAVIAGVQRLQRIVPDPADCVEWRIVLDPVEECECELCEGEL